MIKSYLPNQHGAWAMLVLPFALGITVSHFQAVHVLFFWCWLLAYLFSYPVLQWIKTGKRERYLAPTALYGAIFVPSAIALLALRPELSVFGTVAIPIFLINMYYAKRKQERALMNDIAAIFLFCSIVFPVFYVGEGESWISALEMFVISFTYFVGTALYVKTIIRERDNPVYYKISVVYHLLAAAMAAVAALPALTLTFVLLLVRSIVFPKIDLSVKQTGMLEIAFASVIYTVILCLTLAAI